jgi:TrmH family RNA methyltransferase
VPSAEPATRVHDALSLIRSLQRPTERRRTGLFHLESVAVVLRAAAAGVPLELLVHDEVLLRSPGAQRFVRHQRRAGVPTVRVSPEQFRSASFTNQASGLAAIGRQRWTPLAEADPRAGLAWVVVESLRSPGNLGTIARTAAAAGCAGLILCDPGLDPYSPSVIRSAMGGLFDLRLVRATIAEVVAWARDRGVQLLGTSPRAPWVHTEVPLKPPLAVLLGHERQGLTDEALGLCDVTARIPIHGHADSLNVGVACGVMLYEVLRRKPASQAGDVAPPR